MRLAALATLMAAGVLLAWPAPAAAQLPSAGPPGPYVIDLRGATSGLPTSSSFYPTLDDPITVPARGFGFEAGGHVYPLSVGPARLGLGLSFTQVRGTSPGLAATVRLVAPQVSFNFGTSRGWSYLSAGLGTASMTTRLEGETAAAAAAAESGSVRSLNFGGGARWFITGHLAASFDVRFHRLSAGSPRDGRAGTPGGTLTAVSAGLSIK